MESLKQIILSLSVSAEQKEQLLKELKTVQKMIDSAEFRYRRTLMDKEAITNILNASIGEIEKQKKIIEDAKNEINETLVELDKQKKLIELKNSALNEALTDLKATQSQLIHAEKMASLGELTAGVAHEIQNPLNFVNNFSEVNEELLMEMKDELDKGKIEEAKALANDAIENQKKINHHGKRADAIVKGMLQHSRSSSGVKEPTDINSLTEEYLRLSYHGLRAKDKSFNAKFETDLDPAVGQVKVVPQEIGRIILNLINNAFYAASLPTAIGTNGGFKNPDPKHVPTVWISTKRVNEKVLISVRDNGPGIPANILDKIFQPFFTTKPTGQGTGLGLSLSYDIVKAHGGELKVETEEGKGANFIVAIPIT
jgi:signal transduction histidine kinase